MFQVKVFSRVFLNCLRIYCECSTAGRTETPGAENDPRRHQEYPVYMRRCVRGNREEDRTQAQYTGYRLWGIQKERKGRQGKLLQYIAPQDLRAYGLIPEIIGRLANSDSS